MLDLWPPDHSNLILQAKSKVRFTSIVYSLSYVNTLISAKRDYRRGKVLANQRIGQHVTEYFGQWDVAVL